MGGSGEGSHVKANTRPKHPPAITGIRRDLAECWLPTTEQWGGSYFVCDLDPARHAAPIDTPEMACRVTVYRHLNRPLQRTDTPDLPDIWRYRVTVWGTDDLMRGRWFDTEAEALSCFLVLCKNTPITFAFLDTLGLLYD
jgi:hypothetical protein